ncbi:TIGR02680 family protein [Catellatospora bangladeshensis]|uniref:TIGR02680 family protein n=1 Tax=Catellatospora bangladeshensis TaxID=310355 RepID=A0A8J3JRX0_9ACTN|nr:TIGR02680 family protein [Catellatospora bangladeshensis]GIF85876.1 TIGR02680 family protein [Catellatospora bangladeshensis]
MTQNPQAGTPRPDSQRWRPLRCGLVDIFYYDIEEFHFHKGGLLLRGNNGTGKSKVLALTMPFLLDGELSAYRVEPDGDKDKRMEWNLLLGGKHPHPERLGYTWMEFGRCTNDGAERYLTIGCGLKAATGRGIAKHWYFVTDRRIGQDLDLVGPSGVALTRDRLKDTLGARGTIYDRAADYRRAVDEALFGLGDRYEPLVSLLIQLRQPQLTKRPDEAALSRALTGALPPLDPNLIAQVAEAFRSLDDERTTLQGLQEARKAADDFLGTYTRYAKVAAKRRATGPRQAHSRYEAIVRDLAEQDRIHQSAQQALDAAETRLGELDQLVSTLLARRDALHDSPGMRAAKDLDLADQIATERERIAHKQQDLLTAALNAGQRLSAAVERTGRELTAATVEQESATGAVREAARNARIENEHTEKVERALTDDPPYQQGRQAASTLAQWREQSTVNLRSLLAKARAADGEVHRARDEADRLTAELAQAQEHAQAAEDDVEQQTGALATALHQYLGATAELKVPDLDVVIAETDQWGRSLDGPNPATTAITAASAAATAALAHLESNLGSARATAQADHDRITAQLQRLTSGDHDAPTQPYTRSPQARTGPGAPLWKVVDFEPSVSPADRAGLEAALEAAGLLDAWLQPDGTVLAADTDDVLLVGGPPVPDNLTRLLRPAIDAGDEQAASLSDSVVISMLSSIGLGSQKVSGTWVTTDGRFANGVLAGSWRKDAATHIGEGAREAARRARIAHLRAELAAAADTIASLDTRLDEVARRQRVLAHEAQHAPGDGKLREAHAVLRERTAAVRRTTRRQLEANAQVEAAREKATLAHQTTQEFADDVDLPTDPGELDGVAAAVGQYRTTLAAWWPACAQVLAARRRADEASTEHATATARIEAAQIDTKEAAETARAARERHAALLEASGATVAQLQQQLKDLGIKIENVVRDRKRTHDQQTAAVAARGQAEGRRSTLADELSKVTEQRDSQVDALRHFARSGLLEIACPDLEIPDPETPWSPTPAIVLARTIDRILAETDDSERRWEREQQHVSNDSKTLTDILSRHNHQTSLSVRDGIILVDVTFQGRTRPIASLATALAGEVDERQRILSAHEREILENHLVNEVAGALQELITTAESQVQTMNDELEQRPTSTGMQLRLVWRTAKDAPEGLAELRDRQLRQSTDVWDDDDRTKVGWFLQRQIANERLRDDSGTWLDQLTNALDYRTWHEFKIERRQDSTWVSAAGPASGGERVLAASIPLFAAAASYYSSASPHAPRLIALDEAFAGVDDDSRAKCLGLMATFDLDVMMTSEREWGCYPQVPGLAIAQLSRYEGIDAVLVTPWRWDGSGSRYQVPRPAPRVPSQATVAADTDSQPTLL